MTPYGATFDIDPQESYDKTQVAIRIVILIVLSIIAGAVGWIFGLAYLIVPVVAAVMISQKGAASYFAESDRNMKTWLRMLIGFYAYLGMLTDKLPGADGDSPARVQVTPSGEPTAGAVLLRIILAIPHAIVLGLLGIVAGIFVLVAAIMVLLNGTNSEGIFSFLRGYARWNARMYAYLAGFVQEYPPFALDTGSDAATPPAAAEPTSGREPSS
ncbi:MAG: DUF4389 domain-containing protein [Dehalococcoidia bacterium]|nr:DUF4389 domain-containing protein [Dehalococcoidia bacterium]